jgi:hypothetical protein
MGQMGRDAIEKVDIPSVAPAAEDVERLGAGSFQSCNRFLRWFIYGVPGNECRAQGCAVYQRRHTRAIPDKVLEFRKSDRVPGVV